jgi:hypothetical protein
VGPPRVSGPAAPRAGTAPAEIECELPPEVPAAPDPTVLRRRETERRHTQNFLSIFASTIAVGLVSYAFWLGLWILPFGSSHRAGCAPGTPTPTAAPIKQTSVRVYNATDRPGLALNVARDLQKRGFLVPMWDNDTTAAGMKAVAEVRHGPNGLLNARTVAAQVNGTATLVLDNDREGPTVDLVLGRAFSKLRSPAEAGKLIATPAEAPEVCPSGAGASSADPTRAPGALATMVAGAPPASLAVMR